MKNTLKAALALFALVGVAGSAKADLTQSGAVGLPLNPTAQIPGEDGIRLQANYFDQGDVGGVDFKNYGLFAATRVGERIEINGGINKLDTSPDINNLDRTGFAIGAKYLITRESDPAGVRLAVGAGYDRGNYKNTNVYGVATKYLGEISGDRVPITGHLGVRYDDFDSINSSKVSVFAGVEIPITRTGEFQFVGEVGSDNVDNGDVPYSAALRYRPKGQPFGATIGIARQGVTTDNGLFVQLGYTFGR